MWVRRRGEDRLVLSRAEDLAWAADLYTLSKAHEDRYFVDRAWDLVEQNLAMATDALRSVPDEPLDAQVWIHVLVGFVCGLFVRSPHWEGQLSSRFADRGVDLSRLMSPDKMQDNANVARFFELQRVSPAVVRAEWHILRAPQGTAFLSNDIGRTTMKHFESGSRGYAIPMAPDLALAVLSPGRRLRLRWTGTRWTVQDLRVVDLRPADVHGFNKALWDGCVEAVFGSPKHAVSDASSRSPEPPVTASDGSAFLGVSPADRRTMEHVHWQVRELVSREPEDGHDEWTLDELDGSWIPGIPSPNQ